MKNNRVSIILNHILSGINYMLPCVVAGGILMGLGYMFDDISINATNFGYNTPIASFFSTTGSAIFGLMLPILSAFIGKSVADSEAAFPAGFAGGYLAGQGKSGFLGAIFAGFIAGYSIKFLKRLLSKIPENLDGFTSLLLVPLISVAFMGVCSLFILEPIVGWVNTAMNNGLMSMSGSSKVILGFIVGAMQAADMGGPINKTAYLFATASLANGQYDIMAAVLAGGIVPPYITALASTLFKNKFTAKQRQTGFTNYIIGLAGITEAAIPFLIAEPVSTISSCMIGAGIAGALSMFFNCTVMAPFGGVFIFPLNSNLFGYVISIVVGIFIGTIIYGLMKKKVT